MATTAHPRNRRGQHRLRRAWPGPLRTADGRPLLFMIGQPMDASGFDTLASHFLDRTVVLDDYGIGPWEVYEFDAGTAMTRMPRPTSVFRTTSEN